MFTSLLAAGSNGRKNGSRRRGSKNPADYRLDSAVIETLEGRLLFAAVAFTNATVALTEKVGVAVTGGTDVVTTNNGNAPDFFSEIGNLPKGVTFAADPANAGDASFAGTPAAGSAGVYPVTVVVANATDGSVTEAFTITVQDTPAFTTTVAGSGATTTGGANATFIAGNGTAAGTAGTVTIHTSGQIVAPIVDAPVTTLDGLTFTDNGDGTATIHGTPTVSTNGNFLVTLTASNSVATTTELFTITVDEPPHITSAATATFEAGVTNTFSVASVGTTLPGATFTEVGTLPTGVVLSSGGVLNGTPTAAAGAATTFPITIVASNSAGTNTEAFTLTVDNAPTFTNTVTPTSPPIKTITFQSGVANTFTFTTATSGTAVTYSAVNPLPGSDVTFIDNGDGTATLAGTPKSNVDGTYGILVTATNTDGSASETFKLVIAGKSSPSITSKSSLTVKANSAFSFTVTTHGSPTAALSESGTLPDGVTFVDNGDGTGTISGTAPTDSGAVYPIAITAANGNGHNAVQTFKLTVTEPLAVTSANTASFTVGTTDSFDISTVGFPVAKDIHIDGGLPSGLKLVDNHDGTATITGDPKVGSGRVYNLIVVASSSAGTIRQSLTLTVAEAPSIKGLTGTTKTITIRKGSNVNETFSLNGFSETDQGSKTANFDMISTALAGGPTGLTLAIDSTTGKLVLSGTTTDTGTFPATFSLESADMNEGPVDFTFEITVK